MAALDLTYALSDRYARQVGRAYLTGTQALVRLVLAQAEADRAAGLDTRGFVSGYRGSPLGAVDQEMWRAQKRLHAAGVRFQPAINEELGAVAVMGAQRVETDPERAVADGVFALWYGKGPGLDRAGDALHHGHAYGSSPHGGVLVVAGDDHGCVSSSMSHQSDRTMQAWSMPVIHPASVAEIVPFGLWGWAASRFSGAWVGLKAISETVEGGASVEVAPAPTYAVPDWTPPEPLHLRWPDLPGPQIERRLPLKLDAVRAFARANPLDRFIARPANPRMAIVTVGKAHLDVMEALRLGGVDAPAVLERAGVALLKLGLVFPVEPSALLELAGAVEEILIVEEKDGVVEGQVKELLYNHAAAGRRRARVVGKTDESGRPLLSAVEELRPSRIAGVLAARLAPFGLDLRVPAAWTRAEPDRPAGLPARTPYFCSGCPHNTSTKVPDGSEARAGIGCHFMANWMDRATSGIVPMGGEGADWAGQASFTRRRHLFQNMGDGTFFHSGHLAIRQAVSAGVNVTYKVLYNDAVAMTGGQPIDGTLTVPQVVQLALAEGARRVVVVADDAARHPAGSLPAGVAVHDRGELDRVQRELRAVEGVTVLVYDQTCAAEKRRRRKREAYPDPPRRAVINDRVCEGCGDCQAKSNCLSVVPLDTEFGRKRTIDQSSCNKDFSCVQGFCPSFVTVEGGTLRRGGATTGGVPLPEEALARAAALPQPATPTSDTPFSLLVAGIGGTGIVTVGAVIAMAAHLEGQAASVLDFMGFAQKGGAVLSHVRVARDRAALHQVRIDRGQADALIAADLVVATSADALGALDPARTRVVANRREISTGAMLRDPAARLDPGLLERLVRGRSAGLFGLDAQDAAERLVGDAIAANMLMLGVAWQLGLVPVSFAALDRAVELNGVAVAANRLALAWGRLAAAEPDYVARLVAPPPETRPAQELPDVIARREAFLAEYGGAAYAARYRARLDRLQAAGASPALLEAAARNLFKLMAIKDEYEVARLYTDGPFLARIRQEFEGDVRLRFHLAPPLLARTRPGETEPRKIAFGPWMLRAFRVLAAMRRLRGTPLDVFGMTRERRMERALLAEYEAVVDSIAADLAADPASLDGDAALALLRLPDEIRGFGPVKERAAQAAAAKRNALLVKLHAPSAVEPPSIPADFVAAE